MEIDSSSHESDQLLSTVIPYIRFSTKHVSRCRLQWWYFVWLVNEIVDDQTLVWAQTENVQKLITLVI